MWESVWGKRVGVWGEVRGKVRGVWRKVRGNGSVGVGVEDCMS